MSHNISLPRHLYCEVDLTYLHDMQYVTRMYRRCVVHGLSVVPGQAVGFHVLMDDGARFSDLPVSALRHSRYPVPADSAPYSLQELELWDCFGWDAEVVEYEYLKEMEVQVYLVNAEPVPGVYVLTIDWVKNGFSEEPSQHKEVHLVALENGQFALQPNNRVRFVDSSFVTLSREKPTYLTNTHRWSAESDFSIPDSPKAFYDVVRGGVRSDEFTFRPVRNDEAAAAVPAGGGEVLDTEDQRPGDPDAGAGPPGKRVRTRRLARRGRKHHGRGVRARR